MKRLRLAGSLALAVLAASDVHSSWEIVDMTPPTPRLQAVLAQLEPHCFGRFMIDVPAGATVAWGETLGVQVEPGRAGELAAVVKEREDQLKSQPRYPLTKGLKLYLETRDGALPGMKHVISQNDFDSEGYLRIDTFFPMGDSLVAILSYALTANLEGLLDRRHDLARRLRPRAEHEIPTDAGMCIENAFLADRPNAATEAVTDFIGIGFRLKEPADAHLSIDIQAANDEWAKPGLEKRLADAEITRLKEGHLDVYGGLTVFRRAHREVPAWKDGYEFLTRTPNDGDSKAHHDFWMISAGQKDSLLRPYVDVRMQTGVSDNAAGSVVPSLSDAESVALWDALTATIRVRPTPVPHAEAAPEAPLGTLAATGRACPRTGVWQCAEEGLPIAGGRRRWFREGEIFPSAVLLGDASLWQRWKGEAPSHASPTVWKLVGFDR